MRKGVVVLLLALSGFFQVGYGGNVLTQDMIDKAGSRFLVENDYSLEGKTIVLRKGMSLVFQDGSIDHGEIVGDHSSVEVNQDRPAFGVGIVISGVWEVRKVQDKWFAFDDSPDFVSNQIISNMLAFSNDSSFCHICFDEPRTYWFELPYKGRGDLGKMFSYEMVDGKKKIHYDEIYNPEYSFLRIFTIPSKTWLTINNHWKMLPTDIGAYFVFWEYGKEQLFIDGEGSIAGDNQEHLYTKLFVGRRYYGEWGILFMCMKCHNVMFRNLTLSDAFGDCIIFQGSLYADEQDPRYASDLVIDNVKILRARRNGIAIASRNVLIKNCHFENCGIEDVRGTKPWCAIDFEPDRIKDYPEIGNQNVLMENCTFKNNRVDVSTHLNNLRTYGKTATTIRNCVFTSKLKLSYSYWIRFENCYIPYLHNEDDERSVLLHSNFMVFDHCEFGRLDSVVLLKNSYIDCKYNTAIE